MRLFTFDNTDGFTEEDMVLINKAATKLYQRGMELDSACDRVSKNWQPSGNTVESLFK